MSKMSFYKVLLSLKLVSKVWSMLRLNSPVWIQLQNTILLA